MGLKGQSLVISEVSVSGTTHHEERRLGKFAQFEVKEDG